LGGRWNIDEGVEPLRKFPYRALRQRARHIERITLHTDLNQILRAGELAKMQVKPAAGALVAWTETPKRQEIAPDQKLGACSHRSDVSI
jgi:hypothetical protein